MDKRKKSIYIVGSAVIAVIVLLLVYAVLIITGVIQDRENTLTVTANSISRQYDGTALEYVAINDDGSENFTVEGKIRPDHAYEVVSWYGKQEVVGSSSCSLVIKIYDKNTGADVTENYSVHYDTGKLSLYYAELTVNSGSSIKEYDSLPLKGSNEQCYVIGTPVEGHKINFECFAEITVPGTVENVFSAYIFDENNKDITDLYKINYGKIGTLTVQKAKLTIQSGSAFKIYDGTPLTCGDYTPATLNIAGHSLQMDITGTITEPGTAKNLFYPRITETATGKDVTGFYDITLIYGDLKVSSAADARQQLNDIQNEILFKIISSSSGTVYLRGDSYSQYQNTDKWSNQGMEDYTITSINPLNYLSNILLTSHSVQSNLSTLTVKEATSISTVVPWYVADSLSRDGALNFTERSVNYGTSDYEYDYIPTDSFDFSGIAHFEPLEIPSYDEYVKNNYLSLPDATKSALLAIASENSISDFSSISTMNKKLSNVNNIVHFIRNSAVYDTSNNFETSTAKYEASEDYAVDFFDYKVGVCRHFATAATAMFRALGLPARYVTGFMVNGVAADTETEVQIKNGHAWTEIYFDGYGWIQLEVTASSSKPQFTVEFENIDKKFDGGELNYTTEQLAASAAQLEEDLSAQFGGEYEVTISDSVGLTTVDVQPPAANVKIMRNGEDVTKQFDLSYSGSLTVTQNEIKYSFDALPEEFRFEYDGLPHTADKTAIETLITSLLPEGKGFSAVAQGEYTQTNVGDYKDYSSNLFNFKIFDVAGNDVSSNFKIILDEEDTQGLIRPTSGISVSEGSGVTVIGGSGESAKTTSSASSFSVAVGSQAKTQLFSAKNTNTSVYATSKIFFDVATGILFKTYDGTPLKVYFNTVSDSDGTKISCFTAEVFSEFSDALSYDTKTVITDSFTDNQISEKNFSSLNIFISGVQIQKIEIRKAIATIAFDNISKIFDGKEVAVAYENLIVSGILPNYTVSLHSLSDVGIYKHGGEKPLCISVLNSDRKSESTAGNNLADNYDFTVSGTITVTPLTLTFTEVSFQRDFNGLPYIVSTKDGSLTADNLPEGFILSFETASADVDEYAFDELSMSCKNADGESFNTENLIFASTFSLKINVLSLVATVPENTSKTFDGESFSVSSKNFTVLLNKRLGFDFNLSLTTNAAQAKTYTQTEVLHSFTFDDEEVKAENYTLAFSAPPILTISKLLIIPELAKGKQSKSYDGLAYTVSTADGSLINELPANFEFKIFTNSSEVGDYDFSECNYALLYNGLSVATSNYTVQTVDLTLSITKIKITPYSVGNPNVKTFDGKPFTLSVANGELVANELPELWNIVVYTNSENVGEYVSAEETLLGSIINAEGMSLGSEANLELDLSKLILTIEKLHITFSAAEGKTEKFYDGTPLSLNSESGDITSSLPSNLVLCVKTDNILPKIYGIANWVIVLKNTDVATSENNYELTSETNLTIKEPDKITFAPKTDPFVKIYDGLPFDKNTLNSLEERAASQQVRLQQLLDDTFIGKGYVAEVSVPDLSALVDANEDSPAENSLDIKVLSGDNEVTDYILNIDKSNLSTLTIRRREITIRTSDAKKPYDGTPLTENGFTITSTLKLAATDTIVLTANGSQTEIGFSDNTFTYEITREDVDKTDNYVVTEAYGSLEVQRIELLLTMDDGTWEYDGKHHINANHSTTNVYGAEMAEDTIGSSNAVSITEPGEKENYCTPTVGNIPAELIGGEGVVDVHGINAEYDRMYRTARYILYMKFGKLTVTKIKLHVEAQGSSTEYNGGTQQSSNKVNVIGTILKDDELIVNGISFTESEKTISNDAFVVQGTDINDYAFNLYGDDTHSSPFINMYIEGEAVSDWEKYYELTVTESFFKITKIKLEFNLSNYVEIVSKTFDGEPLNAPVAINAPSSGNVLTAYGHSLSLVYSPFSITYAGTKEFSDYLTSCKVIRGTDEDVTELYYDVNVVGSLTVSKLNITIQPVTCQRDYNSLPLTASDFEIIEGTLPSGYTIENVTYGGSQTLKGQSASTILTYSIYKDGAEASEEERNSINVIMKTGILKVTDGAKLEFTAHTNTFTKSYDGAPLSTDILTQINNGAVSEQSRLQLALNNKFSDHVEGFYTAVVTADVSSYSSIATVFTRQNKLTIKVLQDGIDVTSSVLDTDVTHNYGTVSITRRTINVTASSETLTVYYNLATKQYVDESGNAIQQALVLYGSFTALSDGITISTDGAPFTFQVTAECSVQNGVGETTNVVKNIKVFKDGVDVTANFAVTQTNGTLKIIIG